MVHKRFRRIIKLAIAISIFFLNCSVVYANNKKDTLICKIYFGAGFINDTVKVLSKNQTLFNSIILNSNVLYGKSSKEIWVYSNGTIKLIKILGNKNHKILKETHIGVENLLINNYLPVKIIYRNNPYSIIVKLNKLKFITVYKKWCAIFLNEFSEMPGFD